MLDEGTKDLDSVEIAKRKRTPRRADLEPAAGLDSSGTTLNALNSNLAASLDLFADIVRNPAFRDADIARIRGQWLADIAQEKTQPVGHRPAHPAAAAVRQGSRLRHPVHRHRHEASIKSLTAADLRAFHARLHPPGQRQDPGRRRHHAGRDHAQLDAVFGDWKAPASAVPKKNIATVAAQKHARVFLVDRRDAPQTLILAGLLAPSTEANDYLEIQTMNGAFGGTFTSRLNMNLREDKHWAYGAVSFMRDASRPAPVHAVRAGADRQDRASRLPRCSRKRARVIGAKPLTDAEIEQDQGQRRAQHAGQLRDHRRR